MSSPTESPDVISLLWPHGEPISTPRNWQSASISDLGLEPVISALNIDGKHADAMKGILLSLCDDAETISYRQEIIEDLLRTPDLIKHFEDLLPQLTDLTYYANMAEMQGLPFQKALGRLGVLELYVQIVNTLADFLNTTGPALRSTGLGALRAMINGRVQEPIFQQMQKELPQIAASMRDINSITLGVNLDHNLRPIGVTLVAINSEAYKGSSLLNKLFGDRRLFGEKDEYQGISQLHTVPNKQLVAGDRVIPLAERQNPLLHPLFKDLDDLITDMIRPISTALRTFLRVSTEFLSALEPEITFYLGALRLINDLVQRGLPMCRAEVADKENRVCIVENCYNLNLALRTMYRQRDAQLSGKVVGNDVRFDDAGRILIITGPNQGGKTTHIQAIALAQILFQAGMYVPGTNARISPVDGIYTHFPVEEKPNAETGRFGEEAQRLSTIFSQATRYSLILLNESLSSTAAGESLYLARDIVRCIRLLGARAAYTTHMHELATSADELNATTPGDSKVLSLVAVAHSDPTVKDGEGIKRTFKIIVSPPMGRSFANELATRYGISFDRIVDTLKTRQVIAPALADQAIQD